jgi:hypothetical protein
LIAKVDKEMGQQTVAAPDMGPGPPGGLDMTPPMYRSEGARV